MPEKIKIIRAADYMPEPKSGSGIEQDFGLPMSEQLLLNLFGDTPDYSNPKLEEIWQEVIDADDTDTINYCLAQGVDVIGDNSEPVTGWRDITVMLKAIERGLIKLEGKT